MRIRWTDPALADFTNICDHSDVHFGPVRGRRTALQIYEAVDSLAEFPNIGRSGRKSGTSELAISGLPFLVVTGSRLTQLRSCVSCTAHRNGPESN